MKAEDSEVYTGALWNQMAGSHILLKFALGI